jgi:hypothetical protein
VTGNLKIFGGPLIPVSVTLQAGAAYDQQSESTILGGDISSKTWHVPVGVGIALTIPNPVFSIKPWLAPGWISPGRPSIPATLRPRPTPRPTSASAVGVDFGFLSRTRRPGDVRPGERGESRHPPRS